MSARPTWSDAVASLRRATPGELQTLWQVARLPLVWAGILANLSHACGAEGVHRHLRRLREAGLVAWVRSSRWPLTWRTAGRRSPDHPPRLFYPTDLGLAVLALASAPVIAYVGGTTDVGSAGASFESALATGGGVVAGSDARLHS